MVGEKILKFAQGKTLLRKQDPFTEDGELATYFQSNKLEFDLTSSLGVQKSLDALKAKDEVIFQCAGRKLMTKLKPASYVCVGESSLEACIHYALGLKVYTHFTSPIRRYSDDVVHRLLYQALYPSPEQSIVIGSV